MRWENPFENPMDGSFENMKSSLSGRIGKNEKFVKGLMFYAPFCVNSNFEGLVSKIHVLAGGWIVNNQLLEGFFAKIHLVYKGWTRVSLHQIIDLAIPLPQLTLAVNYTNVP